jgi:ribosomal protein S18 acetylase RimI-like enzyme
VNDNPVFVIRKYDASDRSAVRRICAQTALMGEPGAAFFDDDEILADALTAYYTDEEPELCFVAARGGRVAGYVLCSKDVRRMEHIFCSRILWSLVGKAARRGVFFRRKNAQFLFHVVLSLFKGEFRAPVFSKDYPATLHINLIPECRAQGVGSRLIEACLDQLVRAGVKGVHFATLSDRGAQFFEKNGFQLLFRAKRSYFRYFLGKDIPISIYGRDLKNSRLNLEHDSKYGDAS